MRTWCVIPVYNNGASAPDVIRNCRKYLKDLLIIDDGSTDQDYTAVAAETGAVLIRHSENRGKGAALRTALAFLAEQDRADNMITIDADGQHDPADLPLFLEALSEKMDRIVVGCRDFSVPNVPSSSRFGRSFANFWMYVETGVSVGDCQSGFRAYPVKYLSMLRFHASHYNFEAEVLVRAVWAGLSIRNIPVHVHYPVREERVSHFRPFLDNFRFTLTHLHLVGLRLLPIPKKRLIPKERFPYSIFRPKELFSALFRENASPMGLAASAGVGTFLAVIPTPGFHIVLILYVTARLHLNKIMALAIQHLFMPPLSPFLCIEAGYFMRHGKFLTEGSMQTIWHEAHLRLYEWFLGSLLLAPFWAVVVGICVGAIASRFSKKEDENVR